MLKPISRGLLRATLGKRLPKTSGRLETPGVSGRVVIRRDRWGIPYVDADSVDDAWYGLGFCQGQDRAVQLEGLLRVLRGTLAQAAGPDALPVDRLSRRIGFRRAGAAQFRALGEDSRRSIAAFARGLYEGATLGCPSRPHELALAGAVPTPFEPEDVLAVGKFVAFTLSSNWDTELARMKILQDDGLEALADLEPPGRSVDSERAARGQDAANAIDALSEDLAAFLKVAGHGGMSNGWAVASGRTAAGRPILANDAHLPPALPPSWYLARVTTPQWSVAGVSFVGAPIFVAGHNGTIAWGVTAGLVDNTDLFLERVGEDGRSVLEGNEYVPCEVAREVIGVKGRAPVVEEVVITKRGPIISPALTSDAPVLSLSATWLGAKAIATLDELHLARDFEQFRQAWRGWNLASFGLVYADAEGHVGELMVGEAPDRRRGWGMMPAAGWNPAAGWRDSPVPFDDMPSALDPREGFVATANSGPPPSYDGPFIGVDWLAPYRRRRITERLNAKSDWDVPATQSLQLDQLSLPWRDMRAAVLAAPGATSQSARALEMLADWDGRVSIDSPAASVYEFFSWEMARRAAKAKAPRSYRWVLGEGFAPFTVRTAFGHRFTSVLVRLMEERPDDWFGRPWLDEVDAALDAAYAELRRRYGADERRWAWGRVRPATLRHAASARRPLGVLLDLGPFPWGGDVDTVGQAAGPVHDPAGGVVVAASMRMVIDVGNWDASRYVLPGGQSGNPLSPHYSDMLPLWRRGEGVPIAWAAAEVEKAAVAELRIAPVS